MPDRRWHIAITGIGLVTPLGIGSAETISRLLQGQTGIGRLPAEDGGIAAARVPAFDLGPLLKQPKNVKLMGLPVRLGVRAAFEAVEQSGLTSAGFDPERIGIYVGSGQTGLEYDEFFRPLAVAWEGGREQDFKYLGGMPSKIIDRYFSLRTLANAGIAVLSTEFNARGPSNNFVHGETASAVAIRAACFDLMEDRCDAAIVAGYDSLLLPSLVVAYRKAGALAGEGCGPHYRPFDLRRDGLVVGEGAVCLVLERADAAASRGAATLGEIHGVGLAAATTDEPGFTADADDIRAAAELAAPGAEFDFAVARGLGTQNDDALEAAALSEIAPRDALFTAFKGYTGYLGAATAATELAIGVLVARHGLVPHVAGLEQTDESLPLKFVQSQPAPLLDSHPLGLYFSSTFGGQVAVIAAQAVPS